MNVEQALQHPDKLGEGAKRRKRLRYKAQVFEAVMKEYKRGTLHSGSGPIVKSSKQAKRIAYEESKGKK